MYLAPEKEFEVFKLIAQIINMHTATVELDEEWFEFYGTISYKHGEIFWTPEFLNFRSISKEEIFRVVNSKNVFDSVNSIYFIKHIKTHGIDEFLVNLQEIIIELT